MDVCAGCGMEGGLERDGPQRICTFCGFMEAAQKEVTERMEGRAKRYKISERKAPLTNFYMANKEAVVRAYASALQCCLLAHVKALCDLGIHPSIEPTIRQIWMRALEVSKLLSPSSLPNGLKHYRDTLKGKLNGLREELAQMEESGEDLIGNEPLVWKYTLWHLLDVETIVWVCYAGCVYLREAVTPIDVSLWISKGKLPFMNLGEYGKRAQEEYGVFFPGGLMRPHRIPEPGRIMERTAAFAKDIGLVLPDPNFPLHLMRFTCILGLPKYVGEIAVELFRMMDAYKVGRKGKEGGRASESMFDSFFEMGALIVVALKYCYGLDGRGEERFAENVPPPPRCWLEWGEDIWERRFRIYEEFDITEECLDGLEAEELGEVVEQCQGVIFADCKPLKEYEGIAAKVKKLCGKQQRRGGKRKRRKTGLGFRVEGERNRGGEEEEKPEGGKKENGASGEGKTEGEEEGGWAVGQNALRFGTPGGGPSYIPDSHLLPCSVYWLVPECSVKTQADWHLPIDYVCVLAVVSTLVAAKPFDVQTRIQGIEKILVDVEDYMPGSVRCQEESGTQGKVKRRSCTKTMREALLRGGMEEGEMRELLRFNAGESKSTPEKRSKEASFSGLAGDDLESELDGKFVFHALTHYEVYLGRKAATRKALYHLGERGVMSMPITTEAFADEHLQGDDSNTSPLFNNVELFERAKLAAKFRQPFVTFAADLPTDFGHFPFDVRGAGEVELKEAYMSVSDVESDEEVLAER